MFDILVPDLDIYYTVRYQKNKSSIKNLGENIGGQSNV